MNDITQKKDNITRCSVEYAELAMDWELPIDLCGDTRQMRHRGETWLPKEPEEKHKNYQTRLNRSFLYGGFKDTVKKMVNKPFSQSIDVENAENIEALGLIESNVDGKGMSITELGRDVLHTGIKLGLTHILVDFPSTESPQELLNSPISVARPTFRHIKPNNLFFWSTDIDENGETFIKEIRFREVRIESDGEFGNKKVSYIRIITPEFTSLYRSENDIDHDIKIPIEDSVYIPQRDVVYTAVAENIPHSFRRIPLITFYTNRTGYMMGRPPLRSLAELNLVHWQSFSDQRNILRFARVAQVAATGVTEQEANEGFIIGVNNVLSSINPEATFSYLEHSGEAIEAGEKDLEALEKRMEVLGMQPMMERSFESTATAHIGNSDRANSDVKVWAVGIEDTFTQAYNMAAEWLGQTLPDDFNLSVFTDFRASISGSTDMKEIFNMYDRDLLSRDSVLSESKRRALISEDIVIEEELERIDSFVGTRDIESDA